MRELAEKLFVNERLERLLQRVLDFSDEARGRKLEEITRCDDGITTSRRRLSVLYDGIEAETLSARDPEIAARIKSHRAEIDALNQTAKHCASRSSVGMPELHRRQFGGSARLPAIALSEAISPSGNR